MHTPSLSDSGSQSGHVQNHDGILDFHSPSPHPTQTPSAQGSAARALTICPSTLVCLPTQVPRSSPAPDQLSRTHVGALSFPHPTTPLTEGSSHPALSPGHCHHPGCSPPRLAPPHSSHRQDTPLFKTFPWLYCSALSLPAAPCQATSNLHRCACSPCVLSRLALLCTSCAESARPPEYLSSLEHVATTVPTVLCRCGSLDPPVTW